MLRYLALLSRAHRGHPANFSRLELARGSLTTGGMKGRSISLVPWTEQMTSLHTAFLDFCMSCVRFGGCFWFFVSAGIAVTSRDNPVARTCHELFSAQITARDSGGAFRPVFMLVSSCFEGAKKTFAQPRKLSTAASKTCPRDIFLRAAIRSTFANVFGAMLADITFRCRPIAGRPALLLRGRPALVRVFGSFMRSL